MESTEKKRVDLLEVKDVCEMYHVSRRTVYRWIESGKLHGKKAGKLWLFSTEDVTSLLEG